MIKEWIKLNVLKIFIALFFISIGLNVFLATWKGINITKNYTTNNHQEQMQFQGQLSMNMWVSQGNKVVWKYEQLKDPEAVVNKLTVLPPQYSYFAKVSWQHGLTTMYTIFWPEFMTEKK
jgi:hypothetical protein